MSSRALGMLVMSVALAVPALAFAGDMDERKAQVVRKIVEQSARVQDGDMVTIWGQPQEMEILEAIGIEVVDNGGAPLILSNSSMWANKYYTHIPANRDAEAMPNMFSYMTKVSALSNVEITVYGLRNPGSNKDVAPERTALWGKHFQQWDLANRARGVRSVTLGNGLFPTEAQAKQYGLTQEQLSEIFWAGLDVDYEQLQANGVAVQTLLQNAKTLHITGPNGTDLKVKVKGRNVFVSDGVVSEQDVKRGGPATQVWLPAGEVYFTVVPGTANGTLAFDGAPYMGEVVQDVRFTFKKGKLVDMKAKDSEAWRVFKKQYDVAPANKAMFSWVNIGINPNVKVPKGSKLVTWMPAGTVSLGCGNNAWAGGEIDDVPFSPGGFLNHATVTVDKTVLVKDGKLQVPPTGSR